MGSSPLRRLCLLSTRRSPSALPFNPQTLTRVCELVDQKLEDLVLLVDLGLEETRTEFRRHSETQH